MRNWASPIRWRVSIHRRAKEFRMPSPSYKERLKVESPKEDLSFEPHKERLSVEITSPFFQAPISFRLQFLSGSIISRFIFLWSLWS